MMIVVIVIPVEGLLIAMLSPVLIVISLHVTGGRGSQQEKKYYRNSPS
jgi:hypothetical protein